MSSDKMPANPTAAPTPSPPQPPGPVEFRYTQSDNFVALLHQLRATLLVSTYQANKLLAVRANGQGLSTLVLTFDKPMGLAVDGSRLALGTRKEVWLRRNAPDIAPRIEPAGQHDACYVPRSSHVTGDIGVHEIAWASSHHAPRDERARHAERDGYVMPSQTDSQGEGELWLVSTRFSCLAT